jgi:hypothetical protein
MDTFKFTVMKEALATDPLTVPVDAFEEVMLTLSPEDLEHFFEVLTNTAHSVDESKHVMELIQVLWHYR